MKEEKRLKYIREDNDLTQNQVADILKVKRSTYSLWEIGVSIIPLNYLFEFSKYFGYSIDYSLGLTNVRNNFGPNCDFDLKKIGNNLKTLRVKSKITQTEMSKIINVTQPCIARYEKGLVCMSVSNIYDYSKYFKISVHDIVTKVF